MEPPEALPGKQLHPLAEFAIGSNPQEFYRRKFVVTLFLWLSFRNILQSLPIWSLSESMSYRGHLGTGDSWPGPSAVGLEASVVEQAPVCSGYYFICRRWYRKIE